MLPVTPNILTAPYSHCFTWDWWSDSSTTEPMKAGCTFVSSGHYRMSKSKPQKSTNPTNLFIFQSFIFCDFFHFQIFWKAKLEFWGFCLLDKEIEILKNLKNNILEFLAYSDFIEIWAGTASLSVESPRSQKTANECQAENSDREFRSKVGEYGRGPRLEVHRPLSPQ